MALVKSFVFGLAASLALAVPGFAQTAARKGAPAPAVAAASAAPQGMLRVACSGESLGAEVRINGVFKGECPVDLPLAEGSWTLRASKSAGPEREQIFESTFRLVGGTAKKVDVELKRPTYTAAARMARAEELLAPYRSARGPTRADCPDCPRVPIDAPPPRLDAPVFENPAEQQWLADAMGQARRILSRSDAQSLVLPPAASAPFPCKGAEAAIRTTLELPPAADAPGLPAKLWNVRSACNAKGELEGPVDVWVFDYVTTDGFLSFSVITRLQHFEGRFEAGQLKGAHRVLRIYSDGLSRPTDEGRQRKIPARTGQTLYATLEWIWFQDQPARAESRLRMALDEAVRPGQAPGSVGVSSERMLDSGLIARREWEGSRLIEAYTVKNGKTHGESKSYDADGSVTTLCFQDGKSIEMNPCRVY